MIFNTNDLEVTSLHTLTSACSHQHHHALMNEQKTQTSQSAELQTVTPSTTQPQLLQPNPLQGVGGWLRFFVVIRIYLDPIFTAIMLILAWVGYVSLAEDHGRGIIVSGLIDTVVDIALTVRGIQIGIGLRDLRPRAVQSAKQWLLLVLGWTIISPVPALVLGFPAKMLVPDAFKGIVRQLISFVIWYSYFNNSKRVRATYPDWSENATRLDKMSRGGL